jgi:hypothetical protein
MEFREFTLGQICLYGKDKGRGKVKIPVGPMRRRECVSSSL